MGHHPPKPPCTTWFNRLEKHITSPSDHQKRHFKAYIDAALTTQSQKAYVVSKVVDVRAVKSCACFSRAPHRWCPAAQPQKSTQLTDVTHAEPWSLSPLADLINVCNAHSHKLSAHWQCQVQAAAVLAAMAPAARPVTTSAPNTAQPPATCICARVKGLSCSPKLQADQN
jgi:hypothetical protein